MIFFIFTSKIVFVKFVKLTVASLLEA